MNKQVGVQQRVRSADLMGQVLRRWRNRHGWTQARLGEEAGVRQETISRVENGSPGTELNTVLRLCAAMGVELTVAPKPGRTPPQPPFVSDGYKTESESGDMIDVCRERADRTVTVKIRKGKV